MITVVMVQLSSFEKQTESFSHYPYYHGDDLGLIYSSARSVFRVWSPVAEELQLLFYNEPEGGEPHKIIPLQKDEDGTWTTAIPGDWKGSFYVFQARIDDAWMNEVADPYAKCVGINGKRAMIADLSKSNPLGWETDKSPVFLHKNDAVIYELHVRDASMAFSSGIVHKGKFIGLIEKGTVNEEGLSTGLDHLKELGVTHIQLLPFYDFFSIDETKTDTPQYNWGYEPLNYNVPEGSYSTNPHNPVTRIRELKEMIKVFHENGLRVIMDVTYNHTIHSEESAFSQLVPGYYYRHTEDGKLSDATGCGNETASERPMMRKFILESVMHWVKEYHVDGFRFDLMGVHDITTMNMVSKELHRIRPDILLYGEGWAANESSPLAASLRAIKPNTLHLDRIAVFSDDIRDAIKGNVFDGPDKGFISGRPGMEESIKFGVVASCPHPQIDYTKVNYSSAPYAAQPSHTITYCECHDNHVLWDKLMISAADAPEEERKEMYRLALSILFTSQGISFLHAGTEFIRTKQGNNNSYKAGDHINAIDWQLKTKNKDVFEYVKALIRMRRAHPAFRMKTAQQVHSYIRFEEAMPDCVVAYSIDGIPVRDDWRRIRVYYNGSSNQHVLALDAKNWHTAIINNRIVQGESVRGNVMLAPYSCTVLYLEIPV